MPIVNKSHNITEKVHLFLGSLRRTFCRVWSNNILNKKKSPPAQSVSCPFKTVKCKIFFGLKETVLRFMIGIRNTPNKNLVLQCCTDCVHETVSHTDTTVQLYTYRIHVAYKHTHDILACPEKRDIFLRLVHLDKPLHPELFS